MIALAISIIGTLAALLGTGVLVSRSLRAPRADLVIFAVAMFGLLIGLGAQAIGHLAGFGSVTFRAMELGAQVVAPLALTLALAQVAGKSTAARFTALVFIPALAVISLFILAVDPLDSTSFSKSWPDPTVFYGPIPIALLKYAIGPATLLVAVLAFITVLVRVGDAGWGKLTYPVLGGAVAALLLALLSIAPLLLKDFGIKLPVTTVFAPFCLGAAILTWYAGVSSSRVDLAGVRQGSLPSGRAAGRGWSDGYGEGRDGGYELDDPAGQGVYRDGGLYRAESRANRPYPADAREQDQGRGRAAWADRADQQQAQGDYQTGDIDMGYPAVTQAQRDGDRQDRYAGQRDREQDRYGDGADPRDGEYRDGEYEAGQGSPYQSGRHSTVRPGDRMDDGRRSSRGGDDAIRGKLFGQIAIYTLLEDRVDEFERLSERLVAQVRTNEPDTLVYILHAVPSAPMQRILYEVYRDRAAYDAHQRQPYVTKFDADRRPYVLATNVIELGLQQAKVSPFPSIEDLFGEPGVDTSGFERPDYLSSYGRSPAPRDEARGGY
jgi:quinol monooxygenase YgiN